MEQRTRPSTRRGYRMMWKQLKPFCENLWIREVRTKQVQDVLDNLAALEGSREEDAVRETSLPQARCSEDIYAYSLQGILVMIETVPEPASSVIATAAFTGARRGETRGMWENYREGAIQIARSVWNGHVTDPKSKKSKGAIPIISRLASKLNAYRARQGNPITGPMFQMMLERQWT
jgi:hypothetical protein